MNATSRTVTALVPLLLMGPLPAEAATPTLTAAVGPGMTITLRAAGKAVHELKHGSYVITVSDASTEHNFHLTGPGVNKKTSISQKVKVTWKVTFEKGTYRFVCDAHPKTMKGSFSIT
jgi:plastocyanin